MLASAQFVNDKTEAAQRVVEPGSGAEAEAEAEAEVDVSARLAPVDAVAVDVVAAPSAVDLLVADLFAADRVIALATPAIWLAVVAQPVRAVAVQLFAPATYVGARTPRAAGIASRWQDKLPRLRMGPEQPSIK